MTTQQTRIDVLAAEHAAGQDYDRLEVAQLLQAENREYWESLDTDAVQRQSSTKDWKTTMLGNWRHLVAAAAMLFCLVVGYQAWAVGNEVRELKEPAENPELTRFTEERLRKHSIGDDLPAPVGSGRPRILIQNGLFACKVNGQPMGVKPLEIATESGRTSLSIKPYWPAEFLQPYQAIYNRRDLHSFTGETSFPLRDGDVLVINLHQPSPPWNAVIFPIKESWMLIACQSPWHVFHLGKYLDKIEKGEAPLRFPNTAIVWASLGTERLSRELANDFVDTRGQRKWGCVVSNRFRMVFPAMDVDNVAPPFDTITADELAPHVASALEMLRNQHDPLNDCRIGEYVEEAKRFLAEMEEDQSAAMKSWRKIAQ